MANLFPIANFGKNKFLGTDENGNIVSKDEKFLVKLVDGTESNTLESDKTLKEIFDAAKAGLDVYAVYTNEDGDADVYPLQNAGFDATSEKYVCCFTAINIASTTTTLSIIYAEDDDDETIFAKSTKTLA